MIKIFLIILIPFIAVTLVAIIDKQARYLFPAFEARECMRLGDNEKSF